MNNKLFGREIVWRDNVGCHPSLSLFTPQIEGSKMIFYKGGYHSTKHNHSVTTHIIEKKRGIALVKVDMRRWSGYGFNGNGYSEAIYLMGIERGSFFLHRIQSGIRNIEQAKEWLKPVEIQRAKEVKRQGDFYFIKMKRKSNMTALEGTRHTALEDTDGWIIKHPTHKTLELTGSWKAIHQKAIGGGLDD